MVVLRGSQLKKLGACVCGGCTTERAGLDSSEEGAEKPRKKENGLNGKRWDQQEKQNQPDPTGRQSRKDYEGL